MKAQLRRWSYSVLATRTVNRAAEPRLLAGVEELLEDLISIDPTDVGSD